MSENQDKLTWDKAAESYENLNKKINPGYYKKNPTDHPHPYLCFVWDDRLPNAIERMFAELFVLNWDRTDPDVIVLLEARKQLATRGFV